VSLFLVTVYSGHEPNQAQVQVYVIPKAQTILKPLAYHVFDQQGCVRTINWRESLGNRLWSSMIFCSRKMAIDAKRAELNGKTSQRTDRASMARYFTYKG
jgi:hypothetical protein